MFKNKLGRLNKNIWSAYIGLRPDGRVGEMLARLSVSFLLNVSFFYFEKSKKKQKNVSFLYFENRGKSGKKQNI